MRKRLMKKGIGRLSALCAALLLACPIAAAYPSSGKSVPDGSVLLEGTVIGEQYGWNGTEDCGRAAAFDGDIYTYYDPTSGGNIDCYTGLKLSEPYILTEVCILPREGQMERFKGAMIQGSNDGKRWYTLWQSDDPAPSWDWQVVKKFQNNVGYVYYRYCNDQEHGDVAEVELYGYAGTTGEDPTIGRKIELNEVLVRFDTCGGDTTYFQPITVKFGEPYPAISYTPVREGYVFDGWYTAPAGAAKEGRRADSTSTVTNPSMHTLYAHWMTEAEYAKLSAEPEPVDEPLVDPVQGLCVTLSLAFILTAATIIIAKRQG